MIVVLCLMLSGCAEFRNSPYCPDRISVSAGIVSNYDRHDSQGGPRGIGYQISLIPSWPIRPTPIDKVQDTNSKKPRPAPTPPA